ncbi:MAG: cytochrome bc complex cytochrome b subunit [Candidatus Omnitrophota bacterium]
MDREAIKNGLVRWFEGRYHIEPFKELLTKKEVPVHKHSVWYYFGGITLFLFIVQIITGILLLFYYKPTANTAFDSVKFIMTKVEFGWLIRSIHAWSANLMVLTVFIHMFSTFFLMAYRPPRELTWVSGVILFFLTLGTGFTGYLLPWNEVSFFATKVGTQIAGSVPAVGGFLRTILRGGEEVTDATLGRFFAFHVIALPLCIFLILGLHLAFVQLQGMSSPLSLKDKKEKKSIPFLPNFLLRDILAWTIALGILASLAVYLPAELGKKVDPFAPTPIGIKPEWYFLWMFQALKIIPSKILIFDGEVVGILGFGVMGMSLLILPFIDIWSRKEKRSLVFTFLGVFMLFFIIGMTIWGLLD